MLSFLPRELFVKPPQITLILAIGPWGRGVMHLISPLGGKGLSNLNRPKLMLKCILTDLYGVRLSCVK